MHKDIISAFVKMNLKQKDAAIYLACLHFRQGLFVHEIVSETKIKRSTVDLVLQRLLEMNFVNRVRVGPRYKYFAQSPESILFRQEKITEDFRAILPVLTKLGASQEEMEIRFFEGKQGIRQVYDDMLMKLKFSEGEGRQILSFPTTDLLKIFPDLQSQFIDKRIKMGVWYKAIVPQSAQKVHEYSDNLKELRAVKHVDDKKFPFKVTFEVYGDSVMICSPRKPYGGGVIRNQNIADSMRSLFHLVWNLLP